MFAIESLTVLLDSSQSYISSSAASCPHFMQLCISLTLIVASKYLETNALDSSAMASKLLSALQKFTVNWIKYSLIVGGSYFGDSVPSIWKGREELEVQQFMLC